MMNRTIWNGTVDEARELCEIVKRNCACDADETGSMTRCPPHVMLLDQRALDGLLFVRHIIGRLMSEEMDYVALASWST